MIGFPTSLPRHSLNEKSISRLRNHGITIHSGLCPPQSTPDRIRTCDPRLRRPLLYPTELRAHNVPLLYFIFYYLSRVFLSSVWKMWGLESLKWTVTYQGIKLPSIALVPIWTLPQSQVANLCSPTLGTKSCLYRISLHSLHWTARSFPNRLSYRLLAARVGLEPTTSRLTAERTTIVLPRIKIISTDDRTWTGTSYKLNRF